MSISKLFLAFVGLSLQSLVLSQQTKLEGFSYKEKAAPSGKEWESVEDLALNKEQPRAYFFSFQDKESARKVLPEKSEYWKSLNGIWKFNWVKTPENRPINFFEPSYDVSKWDEITVPSNWNVAGLQKDGSQKYGKPIYVNQKVIFMHKVAVGDWKGGVMRTPPTDWTTYEYRNEVGSYRRDFEIPKNWKNKEVYIDFSGVDSFFYLWINGKYVGFSKNSRNTASFDITKYLKKGKNTVAVQVYRNSDGSFLEAQDMFRLPGIFRTVALRATSKVQIRDINVIPDLENNYKDGILNITAEIRNLEKCKAKNYYLTYSLYENKLYSDENKKTNISGSTKINTIKSGKEEIVHSILKIKNPKLWSAEEPYRYTLIVSLEDPKKGTIETISTYTGFRKVEIKNTPADKDDFGLAGRYYYINGKTVKLKGVNRHETNPEKGHAIDENQMEKEVKLMKRANINHVRNSHYSDNPYWYYLCDKYGIYLEDEANIESHEYYYGDASLSRPIEWKKAHVARVMEMAKSNVNHPSIVIWSLGNEAGPGKNFVYAYNALKKFDKSRPVQYERNNDIVDMGSNQYPSIAWTNGAATGKYNIKYPFHISEYAHSMGNACGNLADYWKAIESSNFICGGAIWDWVDQGIYNYDPKTGDKYVAYGGDFGDTPNDGQFVLNGIMFSDLSPKPQYFEVKKVYQNIEVKSTDNPKSFEIFNKNYFKDLSNYNVEWYLYEDGKPSQKGILNIGDIDARDKKIVNIPFDQSKMKENSEYFLKIQFKLKKDMPWAKAGYVQAEEQFLIKEAKNKPSISTIAKGQNLDLKKEGNLEVITGKNFIVKFDENTGTIYNLKYGNNTVIKDGNGPKIDALRAFVNNDNWIYQKWFENGLHNLKHKTIASKTINNPNGSISLYFTVESQAPNAAKILGGTSSGKNKIEELKDKPFSKDNFKFITNQIFTIYKDGSIELQANVTSNATNLILPRLGYVMEIPNQYQNLTYYGRGFHDNYNDRKTGSFVEVFKNTVNNEFVNFPKPQDMGNHEDTRWVALTNNNGEGLIFIPNKPMAFSALPYSALDLIMAPHPYQLPKTNSTYLRLDTGVTGLGGNSCGQGGPLKKDRVYAENHNLGFMIRPVNKDFTESANISFAGKVPLVISRNRVGNVKISSEKNAQILYRLNDSKKTHTYDNGFNLREGGIVTAWFKDDINSKTSMNFDKIENVPMQVINVSSQESGEGDAENLLDGDINTIWHTMYSVTVAKYPHWVDFDMSEPRTIKGFTYLPRQNGKNGNIKDYSISVSLDGKNWGNPIKVGSFDNSKKEKRILFNKPIKARYIRFTALSEQSGQDFASGAEFSVLGD